MGWVRKRWRRGSGGGEREQSTSSPAEPGGGDWRTMACEPAAVEHAVERAARAPVPAHRVQADVAATAVPIRTLVEVDARLRVLHQGVAFRATAHDGAAAAIIAGALAPAIVNGAVLLSTYGAACRQQRVHAAKLGEGGKLGRGAQPEGLPASDHQRQEDKGTLARTGGRWAATTRGGGGARGLEGPAVTGARRGGALQRAASGLDLAGPRHQVERGAGILAPPLLGQAAARWGDDRVRRCGVQTQPKQH